MSVGAWAAVVGLGAFHGINPAMGWLFAVALGLHRRSRSVVLGSLIPIALGHALAVAVVAFVVVALGAVVDRQAVRIGAGVVLIGWALYHWFRGSAHRARFGMRVGMVGLALWSFLMATVHGAGLMLVPFLPVLSGGAAQHGHEAGHHAVTGSLPVVMAALGVHTLAMLVVTGVIAVLVYEWIGVAFLRRGWINLDLLWSVALIATGAFLLLVPAP
jgi:hypothetical protein